MNRRTRVDVHVRNWANRGGFVDQRVRWSSCGRHISVETPTTGPTAALATKIATIGPLVARSPGARTPTIGPTTAQDMKIAMSGRLAVYIPDFGTSTFSGAY